MPRSKPYREELLEALKDHNEAAAYLNAALEESMKGDAESQELLLNALRNIAEAQGGLGNLAKKVRTRRENLYRIFSSKGNPNLRTLIALFAALGFNLRVA